MNLRTISLFGGVLAVGAMLCLPGTAQASLITYQVRVLLGPADTSNGQNPTIQGVQALGVLPGQEVTVLIYAVLHSLDATHANDGFKRLDASLRSTGDLLGDFFGDPDPAGSNRATTKVVYPWTASGAQNGWLADIDGDTDKDVRAGSTGMGTGTWYGLTATGATATFYSTAGAGAGDTYLLLYATTLTVRPSNLVDWTAMIQVVPRVQTDGSSTTRKAVQAYTLDGVAYDMSTGTYDTSNAMLHIIPEPATLALMGLGLVGLLRRRSA